MRFYVYSHVHPTTSDIVYIGYGSRDRAWKCPPYNEKFYNSGLRSPEHSEWMDRLLNEGYTPNDWVRFIKTDLSKDEAYSIEQTLLKGVRPIFNKDPSLAQKSVPLQVRAKMIELRAQGHSVKQIVEITGYSVMTIYKYLKGGL